MRIKEFIVKKLYGHYNYHVVFNEDVTIIYGLNGSGKTTILNLLNAIISGRLFCLDDYDFEKILLRYIEDGIEKFVSLYKGAKTIFVYDGCTEEITWPSEMMPSRIRRIRSKEFFYDRHPFLKTYSEKFKRVYLPLDRAIDKENNSSKESDMYNYTDTEGQHKPIEQVADIIHKKCVAVELEISKLNNDYRDKTLRDVLMSYNRTTQRVHALEFIHNKKQAIYRVNHIRNSYITFLKELKLLNDTEEGEFREFVSGIVNFINKFNPEIAKKNFEEFMKYSSYLDEIYRLESMVRNADELEVEKKKRKFSINLFLETLNEFLKKGSVDEKQFFIDENSELCLKSKYDENISIKQLSSGERQLVILFTHLIFMLDRHDEAIFIVDEPELSLHMLWQKLYIDKIREVAPNVQIVFATHSPEIISHYSDKLVELVKKREDVTNGAIN